MLVLARFTDEQIHVGPDITLTIVRVKGGEVRVGIDAPKHVKILRGELGRPVAELPAVEAPDV